MTTLPNFEENDVILKLEDFSSEGEDNKDGGQGSQEKNEPGDNEDKSSPDLDDDAILAKSVYEVFVDKGFFEKDDSFGNSFEEIESKIDSLPSKFLHQAVEELPDFSKSVVKFVATAGDNLTEDEFKDYIRSFLNESETVDFSNLDYARSYLKDYYKSQNIRASIVDNMLDALENESGLQEEAEKIYGEKKGKETQAMLKAKEDENKSREESRKQFIENINTELKNNDWADARKKEIVRTIPNANKILSQIISKPSAYIQLIDLLSRFDGDKFDLEHIKKQGESRGVSSIKEKLSANRITSAGTGTKGSNEKPDTNNELLKDYKPIV